jgi:hypothetical protein
VKRIFVVLALAAVLVGLVAGPVVENARGDEGQREDKVPPRTSDSGTHKG